MPDEQNDDNPIPGLRDALKRSQDRVKDLEGQLKGYVFNDALNEFGLDPKVGAGKHAVAAYEGDLDASALTEWLEQEGYQRREGGGGGDSAEQDTPPPGLQSRAQQDQRLRQLEQQGSTPDQAPMSIAEHQKLLQTDPQAALRAFQEGRVAAPQTPTSLFQ